MIRGGAGELTRGVAGEGQVVEVLSLAAVLGRVVLAEWSWLGEGTGQAGENSGFSSVKQPTRRFAFLSLFPWLRRKENGRTPIVDRAMTVSGTRVERASFSKPTERVPTTSRWREPMRRAAGKRAFQRGVPRAPVEAWHV